jgi:hypothetical protein
MNRVTLIAFALIVAVFSHRSLAQTVQPEERLAIAVTNIERNEFGYLISVEITNRSARVLFLPQSSGWHLPFRYRPRIYTLGIGQWSDGQTNLSPIGKQLSASMPPGSGYFSVGPCTDSASEDGWVKLEPGKHISDQIQAWDPALRTGNSVCPMRFTHFNGKLQIAVTAFSSAYLRDKEAVSTSLEFSIPRQ